MKQWTGLGKFLAGHMQVIVPICVALGVLFPQQIGVLKPIVPALFAFMTFQGALSNTFHQVAEMFHRPLHLIVALLVSAALIPIAAYAMGSLFFGSNPNLVCGIVLEYSVPVAVTAFMWISMFGGNGPLALTIILTSSVISPVTIPLTLKLLLGATVSIDVPSMMQDMAFMIAIPAVLGIVINELTRGWGHEKLSPALSPACKFMMMGVIASNSTAMSEYVLHMNAVRLEVALFILTFAISGFVVGFLVARALHLPYSETTTMCFTCGMRNISSGAVIATQYFPGEVVFPVMCGTLFQQVLASFIGHFFERLTGEERAAQRKRVEAGRDAMGRQTVRITRVLVLLYERFQMRTQALSIDIERGLSIDLGQTIADKVGRNHPTRQRLGNGPTAQVIEEQVVRLCATTVVLVQDIAQSYLDRIGEEIRLGLVSHAIAGGDSLRG